MNKFSQKWWSFNLQMMTQRFTILDRYFPFTICSCFMKTINLVPWIILKMTGGTPEVRSDKDIPKISQRYPKDILKISQRYPKDISKISQRYPKDIPKISKDIQKISKRYPKDIPKISQRYPKDIQKIS